MALIKSLIQRLIKDGVAKTCSHGRLRMLDGYNRFIFRQAARHYGLDCFRNVDLDQIGILNPECSPYEPTDYLTFRQFLKLTPPKEGDTLLDLGSGMGWVAIMAAMYPFKKIIGVEISPQFNAIAEKNLGCVRRKLRCRNVQLVTGNAADYSIPSGVTHIYMYNPFSGSILKKVFQNIRQSLSTHPRDCVILFKNPKSIERDVGPCAWLDTIARFKSRSLDGNACVVLQHHCGGVV